MLVFHKKENTSPNMISKDHSLLLNILNLQIFQLFVVGLFEVCCKISVLFQMKNHDSSRLYII